MSHADAPTSAVGRHAGANDANVFTQLFRRLQTGTSDAVGRIVMIDAIVGALLIVRNAGIPTPLPVADTAALVLVAISVFRRPKYNSTPTLLFGLSAVALVTFLVLVTFFNDGDFIRRSVRIMGLAGLAIFIADGRIDVRSLAFGAGLGLVANIPLFYAGLAPADYGSFLTGYLDDKNLAGLYYAVFPLILAGLATTNAARWWIFGVGAIAVLLTGSRTSLAALAIGIVWFVAARRMPLAVRALFGVGLYFVFDFAENNLAHMGAFADRDGTDALRQRIDAASLEKLSHAPWYGEGLGTAFVEQHHYTWFFHNSYWGLQMEGGWPFLIAILGMYLLVAFLPRPASGVRSHARVALEAAAIALLLCAFRLGEVFITIPSFLILGAALFLLAEDQALVDARGDAPPAGPKHA